MVEEKKNVNLKGETFWIDPESIAGKAYRKIKRKFKTYGHRLNMPNFPNDKGKESYIEIDIKCMHEITNIVDILVDMGFNSTVSIDQCIIPMLQTTKNVLEDYSKKGNIKTKNLEEIEVIMKSIPKEYLSKVFA